MSIPQVPFKVVGIEEFNVVPIVKDQIYNITAISDDGNKWQTRGPDGKLGWFPARMAEPLPKKAATPVRHVVQTNDKPAQPRQVTPITQSNKGNPNSAGARQQPRTQDQVQMEPTPERRTPVAKTPTQTTAKPAQQNNDFNFDDIIEPTPERRPVAKTPATQPAAKPAQQNNDFNVDDILASFKGFDDI